MDPNTPLQSLSHHLTEPTSIFRTPSRRQQFTDHEINPLLSNLSPSSTLEALVATDAVPTGTRHRRSFIQTSVASASTSERAWGIKAALAGKKLREWYGEISEWPWPADKARGSLENASWSGYSARTIQEYEERIEVVRDDMETLDVEDLKNYVRSTHLRSSTRKSSISSLSTEYDHLGDFTAIITATIVQVLPTLSRLTSLLDIWTTRLVVLRQVPRFARDMTDCQESMLSALMAIERPGAPMAKRKTLFLRQTFLDVQAVLKDQIAQLGRQLDNMLDLLEGSQDALPEKWIDDLENIEKEYSSWVVKAEEQVLSDELDGVEGDELDRIGAATVQARTCHDNLRELSADPGTKAKDGPIRTEMIHEETQAHVHMEPEVHKSPDCPSPDDLKSSIHLDYQELPRDESTDLKAHVTASLRKVQAEPATPLTRIGSNTLKSFHRPTPLVLEDRTSSATTKPSDADLDTSDGESVISDYFSDKSSPELRSASVVEYVCSPTVAPSPCSNRDASLPLDDVSQSSSLHIEQGSKGALVDGLPAKPNQQRSNASTCLEKTKNDSGNSVSEFRSEEPPFTMSHGRTRSASLQVIGIIPNKEIRKVTIRRSGSYTSSSPSKELPPEAMDEFDSSPVVTTLQESSDVVSGFPSALNHGFRKDTLESRPIKYHETELNSGIPVPELNERLANPPSSHRFQQVMDTGPGLTPVKIRRKTREQDVVKTDGDPHAHSQTLQKALQSSDDRLEARINSILTGIPTHIRLTSGPEPDAPEVNGFRNALQAPVIRPPATLLTRAQTSIALPTMTLAPAQPKASKSRVQNGEPEIRLYHLHQAGKDAPIKLFVRLVGEAGERVMVRIGGGWADLAEYLKEYASHHGRRSVSDTRFDIQGIPSSPISQSSSSSQHASPMPTRPSPVIAFKRQQTTPGKFESPQTPTSDPSMRPSSRMSWTDEDSPSLGLAGPKTKKVDISPRKQAWVDEMLEQARGGAGGVAIGDIGKVGGTKRVFLKGRSRAGSNV